MTPKRLSPPRPATIAFSDAFALLQMNRTQNKKLGLMRITL
jgi:hypothetical protein